MRKFIGVEYAEFATILAALRFYQERGQGDPGNRSDAIHEIATSGPNGEEVVSLDAAGIDELCERINMERADPLGDFARMLGDADIHAHSLVNADTGALMDVQSIRRAARHILKMD